MFTTAPLAGGVGFEPTVPFDTPAYKAGSLNRSDIPISICNYKVKNLFVK